LRRRFVPCESVISLFITLCLAALLAFVAILAARLRSASAHIAELRAQRDRDIDTIARCRGELGALQGAGAELARAQGALADAQSALAVLRAERDLAREQAAAAQRQRHAFLAGLAHDLRNPLAPLSNGLELLRLTDHDPAGRLRTRGIMERQVGNLMRMADELSDLARLAGDQASLHDGAFDLGDLFLALGDRIAPALQAQEMTLALAPELHDLPPLRGDAQRLGQAFGHLVNDLSRHSERGSTLRVSATLGAGGIEVLLAAAADLEGERALEPVDVVALGLGVALADQLARLHGGRLQAHRIAGMRRVRFTLSLALDERAAAPVASAAQRSADDAALRVLLADDNVDFSHSFGTMLELLGHRVEVVHDGLAAVSAIVGSPPDIAFVDIGMPSLDGVETVRRVRGQGNTQDVVLVAVTGRGGAEDRARAAEAGFDRYLVKPFAMQDVRDALDAARANRAGAGARAPGMFAASARTSQAA